MMEKKLLFLYVFGLVFSIFNLIDMGFTMAYPSAETNILVIKTFKYFYGYKMAMSLILMQISAYKLIEEGLRR